MSVSNKPVHRNHRLLRAVHYGQLQRVRWLISSYGLSTRGYVLLREAVENKHTEIAKLLLAAGSKVNSRTSLSYPSNTPLHFAIQNGEIDIVKMLLDRCARIDAKNQNGTTPLHMAVEKKNMDIIELLLNGKANVNTQNNNGETPLYLACRRPFSKCIIEKLLNCGADINSIVKTIENIQPHTPFHYVVQEGNEEITKLFLSHNAYVDTGAICGITLLHIAAKGGYVHIVKALLKHGAGVNSVCTWSKGYTPLHFAIKSDSEEVVKLLLNHGANIDAQDIKGSSSLHLAAKKVNILKLLLDCGANVNAQDQDGKTTLHLAAKNGGIVKLLLAYGSNINIQDNDGKTPLHLVSSVYLVKLLLEHGANVDAQDKNGETILHLATEYGYIEMVKIILKYGANVNATYTSSSREGYTPLHIAIQQGEEKDNNEIINLLLSNNAHVNVSAKNNITPLSIATTCRREKVVKLLLDYGANVNVKDGAGKTPILLAVENTDLKITKLLLGSQADVKNSSSVLLNTAVKKQCRDIVELLLKHNVNVNSSDEHGITALHLTASGPQFADDFCSFTCKISNVCIIKLEIAKLLLNVGANVDAQSFYDGNTTLHRAAERGFLNLATTLFQNNANVNIKNNNGRTALHIAVQKHNLNMVKILVTFGVNIDSQDKYGKTPLHIASEEGLVSIVLVLLEHGSDINIVCTNNYTPFKLAKLSSQSLYQTSTVDSLEFHIVQMKNANLYVNRQNLELVGNKYENKYGKRIFEKELKIMKSEKISNNISFCDILTTNVSKLAKYARNVDVVQALNSDNYRTKFPVYADLINIYFRKGVERKKLLEQAIQVFHSIFTSLPELPFYCVEQIVSYLSNTDLRILNH